MNEIMKAGNRQISRAGEYQESKALAEVRGKMVLARQFPRDPEWSKACVLRECEVIELAQAAQYEFPRGDSVVRGPSIRLVEVLARHWGNIDFGVNEIETAGDSTTIKCYAWDLESNACDEKTFTVKHERSTKKGSYKLTDERDIYEMVANKGARRKRACLLSILPAWYVDAAVKACEDTLRKSLTNGKTIEETRASLVSAFEEFGISPEQLSEKLGKDTDKFNENDIVKMRHLYSAIKDGFVKAADAFGIAQTSPELPTPEEESRLDALNKAVQESLFNGTDKG